MLVLAISACQDDSDITEPRPQPTLSNAPVQEFGPRTLDNEFANLADAVPGFGGMFFDETGRLTAHLQPLTLSIKETNRWP